MPITVVAFQSTRGFSIQNQVGVKTLFEPIFAHENIEGLSKFDGRKQTEGVRAFKPAMLGRKEGPSQTISQ